MFKACPSSPNCVSTQTPDDDPKHKMSPISYTGAMETAKTHSEFMSKTMKFVDDVEFYFDDANKVIHFRSASRKGHSDMGVNRKRMEAIISAFGKK